MKVKIRLSPEYRPPFAVICADAVTEEVRRAEELLAGETLPLMVRSEDQSVVLRPEEVCLVRVEDGRTAVYTKAGRFDSERRLYEWLEQLDERFVRISKQAVVNRRMIRSFQAGLSGALRMTLKNGMEEYVSRKYLPQLKASLGVKKGGRL